MSISPIDHQVNINATIHIDKMKSEEAKQAHVVAERTISDEEKQKEEMQKIQDVENSEDQVKIRDEENPNKQKKKGKEEQKEEDEEDKKIEEENEKRWGKPKNPVTAPGERRGKILDIIT